MYARGSNTPVGLSHSHSINIPGTGYHQIMNMNQNYMVNQMTQNQQSNFSNRPPMMINNMTNMMIQQNLNNIQRMPNISNQMVFNQQNMQTMQNMNQGQYNQSHGQNSQRKTKFSR